MDLRMGAQKPGFFTKIHRLQPEDKVKNPVSLSECVSPADVRKQKGVIFLLTIQRINSCF